MTTHLSIDLRRLAFTVVACVLIWSTTARVSAQIDLSTHFTKVAGQESGNYLNDSPTANHGAGSGITYWSNRNSFLLIDNNDFRILEMDRTPLGSIRRTINLTGFTDPEEIHWIGGDTFVISQEFRDNGASTNELVVINVPTTGTSLNINTAIRRLKIITNNFLSFHNEGIEGVALIGNNFYFTTERPLRTPASAWKMWTLPNTGSGIQNVIPAEAFDLTALLSGKAEDISGIATDGTYLWLLSHLGPPGSTVGRVIKITTAGQLVADYAMPAFNAGNGSWNQPEGIGLFIDNDALNNDGLMKILLTGEKGSGAGVDFMMLASQRSTVSISAFDSTAAEHTSPAPANPGQFRISRTHNNHLVPLSVNYSITAASTASPSDYSPIGGSVTIPAGDLFTTVNVTPVNDTEVECSETVVATLGAASPPPALHYDINASAHTATVTILDNDNQPPQLTFVGTLGPAAKNTRYTITYEALAAAANESDPNGVVYFRVKSAPSGTLTKNGYPGEPVSPGTTYIGPGENLVWNPPADATGSGIVAFQVVAYDLCSESTPVLPVHINVVNIVVTVVADDPVVVEIPGIAGSSDNGSFTIYRYGDTSGQISVPFQLSGTVTIGGDYYPNISSPAIMGPGVTSMRFPIDAFFGNFYEPNEYLDMQLVSNPDAYIGNPSLARVWFDSVATLPGISASPSLATAANLSGKVVGASGSGAASQAATWTLPANARWENLPASSTAVPSTLASEVHVNDLGAAKYVGNGKNAGGGAVAFVSNGTVPGSVELPGLVANSDRWAYAIRADDTFAVGAARVDASTINACLWDLTGPSPVAINLDDGWLGYPTTVAYDVNELETYTYVGEASGSGLPTKPLVWNYGFMDELPLPSGHDNGSARGINNSATIVGYTWSSVDGIHHAARWEGYSAPALLPLPASVPPEIADEVHSYALRVCNYTWTTYLEVIVGYAQHPSFGTSGTKAVVWYTYGVPACYFLDEVAPVAGSQYLKAFGVNDYGDVSGQISTPAGNKGFVVRP